MSYEKNIKNAAKAIRELSKIPMEDVASAYALMILGNRSLNESVMDAAFREGEIISIGATLACLCKDNDDIDVDEVDGKLVFS